VAWNSTTNALCGGPGNPPCPGGPTATQVWNRDAVLAERPGFDCAKGHPAMGNYHHHQNPSAFKLDLQVLSTICNLYDSDGLYTIDSNQHSPLIGYAYDGFPIYGAYGYLNTNGTGAITRMKSGYQLRNMTTRTTNPSGQTVSSGPAVSTTYPLGYFREDYEFVSHPGNPDYLDEHNGRFCVTPEYPNGIYCYFATVDANWNSAYPYVIGPTFYGVYANRKVTSITEPTTTYTPTSTTLTESDFNELKVNIFPNPATDLIAVQVGNLVTEDLEVSLLDLSGKLIQSKIIAKGSTITFFETETLYAGAYLISVQNGSNISTQKIVIQKI